MLQSNGATHRELIIMEPAKHSSIEISKSPEGSSGEGI